MTSRNSILPATTDLHGELAQGESKNDSNKKIIRNDVTRFRTARPEINDSKLCIIL